MADDQDRHELAVRTTIAVISASAGLLGPDAAAAATAITPVLEAALMRIVGALGQRRIRHAAETLEDAADAAGESVEQLAEKAVSDERSAELLARTLAIAQDTALRDKRRALGRALAAGISGDDAKVDDELLFIRAVADVDTPHIRLLNLMAREEAPPAINDGAPRGWSTTSIAERDPGLDETIPALLSTLESHNLVRAEDRLATYGGMMTPQVVNITSAGRTLLHRLTGDCQGPPGNDS